MFLSHVPFQNTRLICSTFINFCSSIHCIMFKSLDLKIIIPSLFYFSPVSFRASCLTTLSPFTHVEREWSRKKRKVILREKSSYNIQVQQPFVEGLVELIVEVLIWTLLVSFDTSLHNWRDSCFFPHLLTQKMKSKISKNFKKVLSIYFWYI